MEDITRIYGEWRGKTEYCVCCKSMTDNVFEINHANGDNTKIRMCNICIKQMATEIFECYPNSFRVVHR